MREKILSALTWIFLVSSIVLIAVAVLRQIRENKERILCRNNLRHLGTAFHLYASRHQKFPIAERWKQRLAPYVFTSDISCPGASFGYALNSAAEKSFPDEVLLFDSSDDKPHLVPAALAHRQIANRHLGGANLLLVDGSVSYCYALGIGLADSDIGWRAPGSYRWQSAVDGK